MPALVQSQNRYIASYSQQAKRCQVLTVHTKKLYAKETQYTVANFGLKRDQNSVIFWFRCQYPQNTERKPVSRN